MFAKKMMTSAAIVGLSFLGLGFGQVASAACSFDNDQQLKSLTAGFEAWKVVTAAMGECGNFNAELDQEFRTKQPAAFAAKPSLYQIGGVANATLVPLLNEGSVRPLDNYVAQYGQQLKPNQLIKVDGKTYAIAMMVNAQHFMYRGDIFEQLEIAEPKTYADVLAAAAQVKASGIVDYPLGGTYKTGWNLGEEFINMYLGFGGNFFTTGNQPHVNTEKGIAALELMKKLSEYMDPEYLVSDSTYVQQQFQQGKIAMANLWASRAAAMDDEKESQVVGKVVMSSAPTIQEGGVPASSLWWDGMVLATNMSDAQAESAFRVMMEGIDSAMVKANNDVAVWLIDGYTPGRLARGAAQTAQNGARGYPASPQMGIMHTALGNGISDYLTGAKSAQSALADIEAAYLISAKEAGLVN